MPIFAYLFEAKSIQSYILDSGKLKDLVGASELVDALCGDPLQDALTACGLEECRLPEEGGFTESAIGDRVAFSRRAGGAFYAFSASPRSIGRLASFWPLVVQQYAPGLEFDQGRGEGNDAFASFEQARTFLRDDRSRLLVELPQAGPLAHRSQRTGRPAVVLQRTSDGEQEPLDARVARQRWVYKRDRGSLVAKLTPPGSDIAPRDWPRNLDPQEAEDPNRQDGFPFLGDDRYIAVIHADGNGLGQLLMDLEQHIQKEEARQHYLSAFYQVSIAIEQATERAAQRAVDQDLLPHRSRKTGMIPARPIILGGDDLTMIVRADLAIPFTRAFLAAFEEESRGPMVQLRARGLPVRERLTACAGIAYIKASQPFYLGAHLAEGITASVKRQAKAVNQRLPPSSLGWHRITTAMIDDYREALERELTIGRETDRYRNTLGAYAVGGGTERPEHGPNGPSALPHLDDLLDLQALLERPDMARGPTRQLLTLISQSPEQAKAHYRRWCTLMREKANGKAELFERYQGFLTRLIGSASAPLPYRPAAEHEREAQHVGPLGDLHALIAVKNRIEPGGVLDYTPAEDPA